MTLFDDTEIFSTGTGGKKIFDLPDADVMLIDRFFNKDESDCYYRNLLQQTHWREYEMPMYDKIVTAPRMIAWFEDKQDTGSETAMPELSDDLKTIRLRVENELNAKFNAVLLNLYRNGNDSVAWHCDHTGKSGPNPIIASVTFGETRIFRLRHKTRKELPWVEIPLHHGSLLLMAGKTNNFWEHQIPKTTKKILPRINLTFRQLNR
ncbi:alpha-ketoglutarate-dependent dioxygenase AlkB [Flavobacterium magnum]|uniref:Alpha-ketoglutarate-dependent dioxygenase AlkB n=1 Tax=Flavobacterium magnum TaxID=2162713 RepID=A0A2S0RHU7_9FLAO|nr:alpha-ketoglutarate-dependent dioxygenase AlkB [Flavobacterium magnum]AWA31507.1 alpha-ketoglutarate-dependent dioxygenase AlkB [Flavobacterium magnum]